MWATMTMTSTAKQRPSLEKEPHEGRERVSDPIFAQGGSNKIFDNTERPCLEVGMNSMRMSPRVSLDGQGLCKYRIV